MIHQYSQVWGPVTVKGGSEDYVFRGKAEVNLPEDTRLLRIGTFLGVDTGDKVECHAEIVDDRGNRVYARSLHKETAVIYDAWDWKDVPHGPAQSVTINVLCRVTGMNLWVFTKRLNPLTAVFHADVVIEYTTEG